MIYKPITKPELCEYCNELPAKYFFNTIPPNGKWCCSEIVHRCIKFRRERSERAKAIYYHAPINVLKRDIANGKVVCSVCDARFARYITTNGKPVCGGVRVKDCPDHGQYFSDIRKRIWQENPEYREKMKVAMKEVHNRPEVKQKKKEKMEELHHGSCIPCVEFQHNFEEAHAKRQGKPLRLKDRTEVKSKEVKGRASGP